MEKKLYSLDYNTIDIYLQKSAVFLFPLLKIKANKKILQIESYLAWQGEFEIYDNKLGCLYELRNDLEYVQYEKYTLFKNEFFEGYFDVADNKRIYIFNLVKYKVDIDHFLKGKYSLLSIESKKILVEYYNFNKFSAAYMESFIYPEKYFEKYAELLNVDEWRLRSVGELADPFNKEKETLVMAKATSVAFAA